MPSYHVRSHRQELALKRELMMNAATRSFIRVALNISSGDIYPPAVKNSMRKGSRAEADAEEGLCELLRTRELSTLDYAKMTHVEFDSEEKLYSYLQRVYDYVFRGAADFPDLPEE
jgi:hypothetical protein